MSKHGFRIIPKNKKLLKSSKVRKYFAEVEDAIAEELFKIDFYDLFPPDNKWFTIIKDKNDTSN